MATLTAYENRPAGTTTHPVTMELVPALAEDLKYFEGWEANNPDVRIMKLRIGLVYWLYSYVKNEIEPIPYQITSTTDVAELKEYLDAGMIFIPKTPFEE